MDNSKVTKVLVVDSHGNLVEKKETTKKVPVITGTRKKILETQSPPSKISSRKKSGIRKIG
jgi:hypothetical protein